MANDERPLVGIGGWLILFIATLCLGAIRSFVNAIATWDRIDLLTAQFSEMGTAYGIANIVLCLADAMLCSFLVWRLNTRRTPSTPSVVILGLWVIALVLPILDSVLSAILLNAPARQVNGLLAANIVHPLIYAAIWSAYLMRSERVANTYAADRSDNETII